MIKAKIRILGKVNKREKIESIFRNLKWWWIGVLLLNGVSEVRQNAPRLVNGPAVNKWTRSKNRVFFVALV